jgi:hypothetical protein
MKNVKLKIQNGAEKDRSKVHRPKSAKDKKVVRSEKRMGALPGTGCFRTGTKRTRTRLHLVSARQDGAAGENENEND